MTDIVGRLRESEAEERELAAGSEWPAEYTENWKRADICQDAVSEIERLRAFVRWAVTDGPFNGCNLDGGDVQEKAVHFGILRKVEYDPEQHGQNDCGAEPGDPWFVFTFPVHDEQKGNQG